MSFTGSTACGQAVSGGRRRDRQGRSSWVEGKVGVSVLDADLARGVRSISAFTAIHLFQAGMCDLPPGLYRAPDTTRAVVSASMMSGIRQAIHQSGTVCGPLISARQR